MELYIDKENVFSLLKMKKTYPELFQDCIRMMKKNLNIKFNFKADNLIQEERDLFDAFYRDLNYVGSEKHFQNKIFPPRPIKSNCIHSFDTKQLSSVYLLDDDRLETLKRKGCLMIGKVGEEIYTLSKLFFDDYQFHDELNLNEMKGSWNSLEEYIRPITDIICVDRFILDDNSLYENNLYSFLNIFTKNLTDAKINIVLIVSIGKLGSFPLKKIEESIERKISSKENRVSANVTIIPLSYDLKEHDRIILTNYFRYDSGDTFNYFNSRNEKISSGYRLTVSSNAFKKNEKLTEDLIKDLQTKIDEQRKRNPKFYEGKGICNFLII